MTYYETLLKRHGMKLTDEQLSLRNAWSISQNDRSHRLKAIVHKGGNPRTAFDRHGNRICCVCNVAKPAECYSKGKSKIDGKDARCKGCKAAQARKGKSDQEGKRVAVPERAGKQEIQWKSRLLRQG